MNARSPEENSSHNPIERQMNGGALPSLELLDETMKGPRRWAKYLETLFEDRYPFGGRDVLHANSERVVNKKIAQQFKVYDTFLSGISTVIDQHRALSLEDSDVRPANNELTPHIINQFALSSFNRVFISAKQPAQTNTEIKVTQTQLAIESISILEYQKSIDRKDGSYLDKQLFDIDAMIKQLGYIAMGNNNGIPGMAVIPNPHYEDNEPIPTPEFYIFTPNGNSRSNEPPTFDISTTSTADTLDKDARPADVAKEILSKTVIHEIAPKISKKTLGALIAARRTIVEK